METRRFTQYGTFSAILLSLFLIFTIITGLSFGSEDNSGMLIFSALSLILFISLLCFYKIVIEIDSTNLSFKLGIGFFGKSYKLSEIECCKPVKNSVMNGWGIHWTSTGWLYNVSGLKAIELTFKNTAKVVRIGTNKPEEITEILTGLLNTPRGGDPEYRSLKNSKSKNTYIAVAVVLIIVVLINLYQYQPVRINLKETRFEISGAYGLAINYRDIAVMDTISQMPGIEMRTNGFAFGKVCKGNFRLTNIGNAKLFINYTVSPFVQLALKNGEVIYFNLKDKQSTIEMFDKIKSMKKQTQPSK